MDVGVLLGLSGLDVLDGDAVFLGPYQQLATDVFRAVVHPYDAGLAAPFDVEEDHCVVKAATKCRYLESWDYMVISDSVA
jgi:hypothetical protein